mgnify:CR=1 FL=1
MKKFFKDYWDLCKQCGKFYKNHWLGIIIWYIITIAVFAMPAIIERAKTLLTKKNDDEE